MKTVQMISVYLLPASFLIICVHTYPCKSSNYFDILILVQNYPESVCFDFRKNAPTKKCNLGENNEWSIHGLWPTEFNTLNPQFCDKKQVFNVTKLSSIEEELMAKWFTVDGKKSHENFWKHEWDKHGTCATQLKTLNTQQKYFRFVLNLAEKYNVVMILNKANIYPGREYSSQEIFDKVARIVGKQSIITCTENKAKTKSYLLDIGFCFSKSLEIIHCDGVLGYPTNCSPTLNVIYPTTVANPSN